MRTKMNLNKTKIVVLVFLAMFFFFLIQFFYMFQPPRGNGETVTVEISRGMATRQIGEKLEKSGVVRSAFAFNLYARYQELDQSLQAGNYTFTTGQNLQEILEVLLSGKVHGEQIVFTVVEGLNGEQVAATLAAQGLGEEEIFLKLIDSPESFGNSFLKDLPSEQEYPLQGYLFPDTYNVEVGATEEKVLSIMLNRFEQLYNEDLQTRTEELGMTLHEVVTLASIVEREAVVAKERELISAVFHNRLQKNMRLESCATVQYALGEVKPVLSYKDLEVESPYNTYRNIGLPPGPISGVGKASLEAALNPADVDYLFFVTREDGTGGHYFGRTLREHNENIRRSRQSR